MNSFSRPFIGLWVAAALSSVAPGADGDVIELKNGSLVNGKFAGGTAHTVRLETPRGVEVYPTTDMVAVTFTATSKTSGLPTTASASPVAATSVVTLSAGTTLLVRMAEPISSLNTAGALFSARLEYDLVADGVRIAQAGTVVFGKVQSSTQARPLIGRSTLDIRLYQLSVNGQPVTIATTTYREASASSIRKIARSSAAGAVIGEAVDNDADKGATIGAGVGALRPGQPIVIPAGKLLEFDLTQPATVRSST